MDSPEVREQEPGGYAIIGRFFHQLPDTESTLIRSDRYALSPGEGMLFFGADDSLLFDPEPVRQEDLIRLPEITAGRPFHMLVLLDRNTGGLLIMEDLGHSSGISPDWPPASRAATAQFGRLFYGFILGKNKTEAELMILELGTKRAGEN